LEFGIDFEQNFKPYHRLQRVEGFVGERDEGMATILSACFAVGGLFPHEHG
jgi:hypothetical protein